MFFSLKELRHPGLRSEKGVLATLEEKPPALAYLGPNLFCQGVSVFLIVRNAVQVN
jgi:hypothetical protein